MSEIETKSNLASKVVSALRWFAVIRLLSQIFSWGITFYIMRILQKSDYGLFAMATVIMSFLLLVSELGLTSVLLQKKDLTVFHQRQIFGMVIIVGLTVSIVMAGASPLVASFYKDDRLVPLILILATQFLMIPFYAVPRATMERNLDFKSRSIVELVSSVFSSFFTLFFAVKGYGVWALIIGHMTSIVCKLVGFNIKNPFKHLPSFDFTGVKSMISFGGYTMASRWLWFFSTNADVIIAGRLLPNLGEVGLYKFATHIASIPAQKISPIINQIAFPAFAKIQDNKEQVATNYLKAVSFLSLIAFPIMWGLAAIADFIPNYLGDKWTEAIPALRILCFVLPFRMLNGLTPSITSALGMPEKDFINQLWLCICMVSAYLIGCYAFGIMGLVYAWAVCFPIIVGRNLLVTLPSINLSLVDLIKEFIVPIVLSTVMFFSIMALKKALDGLNIHLLFAISIVAGMVIYISLSFLFNKKVSKSLIRYVRS